MSPGDDENHAFLAGRTQRCAINAGSFGEGTSMADGLVREAVSVIIALLQVGVLVSIVLAWKMRRGAKRPVPIARDEVPVAAAPAALVSARPTVLTRAAPTALVAFAPKNLTWTVEVMVADWQRGENHSRLEVMRAVGTDSPALPTYTKPRLPERAALECLSPSSTTRLLPERTQA